jgi:deoxyribonuclease (pyrimidine dimer)
MTRINVLHPSQLSDKHLSGEYHEVTRIFTHVRKAVESGKSLTDYKIPESYRLGKGHVTFFYNKLAYISWRYYHLALELSERAFSRGKASSVNFAQVTKIIVDSKNRIPAEWWGNYIPTPESKTINIARLEEKS